MVVVWGGLACAGPPVLWGWCTVGLGHWGLGGLAVFVSDSAN